MLRRLLAASCVSATVLSGCLTTSTAAPLPAASAPGVTATTIQLATVVPSSPPEDIGVTDYLAGMRDALSWANRRGGVAGRRLELAVESVAPTAQAAQAAARYELVTLGAFAIVGPDLGSASPALVSATARLGAPAVLPIEQGGWLPSAGGELEGLRAAGLLAGRAVVWGVASPGAASATAPRTSSATLADLVVRTRPSTLVLGDDLSADAAVLRSLAARGTVPRATDVVGVVLAPRRAAAWLAAATGVLRTQLQVVRVAPEPEALASSWRALDAKLVAEAGGTAAAALGVLVGLDVVGALEALGSAPTRAAFVRATATARPGPPGVGTIFPATAAAPPLLVGAAPVG